MTKPRTVKFNSEDDALAEIATLKRGYRKHGNWTLPQACWHVGIIMEKYLKPATPGQVATPEQAAAKARFVDVICTTGEAPPHIKDAPPVFVASETAGDAEIAMFERELNRLKTFPHEMTDMGPCGPVSLKEVRQVHLFHAGHHLSFLEPVAAQRRPVPRFKSDDEIEAEIRKLQKGYAQTGGWNLGQICWHLEQTTRARTKPGPHPVDTDEQKARRPILNKALADGQLPGGLTAPPFAQPALAIAGDPVELFLKALKEWTVHTSGFAPHRLFGMLSEDEARRLNRMHCAHHLSFLVPIESAARS